MSAERTPDTDIVRLAYIDREDFVAQIGRLDRRSDDEYGAEFDAWLRKVRAETLRAAAGDVLLSSFWADGSDNYADRVRGYLGRAADQIEKEG